MKEYIGSFRLRTLPLSIAGIIIGSCYAYQQLHLFSVAVFVLALCTTLSLQILSNLSNELGDALKGTDNENRSGPHRGLQLGLITQKGLQKMIIGFIVLSLLFGLLLIYAAFGTFFSMQAIVMALLGLCAIVASIKYTLGKGAYGYMGLGDLAVFLFFGLLSTAGAFYLQSQQLQTSVFLLGSVIGLLSVGVLNVNNVRDMENDKACGKQTFAARIGMNGAKIYHVLLILAAFVGLYLLECYAAFYLTPLFLVHLYWMLTKKGKELDKQLPFLSISTLLLTLVCSIELLLH